MTKISKNVRVLLCAFALSISAYGMAKAQDSAPGAATVASSAPPVDELSFRLSLVTEEGSFKKEFNSFREAYEASQGNSYNQTLKKGNEIIVMNARCGNGDFIDKVTFSLYRIDGKTDKSLSPIVQSYLDYIPTEGQKKWDLKQREMIDEVMKNLANSRFPHKADCDPVPVALSLPSGVVRLEVDDAQSPLVGTKFNDGLLYDALSKNDGLMASAMAQKREFWERYGYNRFSTAQDALNTAALLAGTKIIIFNGTNFSLYRLGAGFKQDYKADETQYDVFKTTPVRKDWKIVAIVYGKKFIRIYEPEARE